MEFWIKNRCQSCHHTYRFKAVSDFDDASDVEDKPCPKCSKEQKTRGMDVSAGKAPSVGGSDIVRAMDHTADIVMDNYQMTDLNSDGCRSGSGKESGGVRASTRPKDTGPYRAGPGDPPTSSRAAA